ncbi:MAG: polysaccharide biosynthesis/export family protein [Rhodobacteraceae bacterium]|nr:polysaccharide biosynthesis/export family protein [Paracoccaceae bacterium]
MQNPVLRGARLAVLAALVVTLVAACGLPRSGPNKREIFAGSVQREGDAFVVAVNNRVTRATAVAPAVGFDDSFMRAGRVGSDVIRTGDVLGLTIFENIDDGLIAGPGGTPGQLQQIQVDDSGNIFVPYAGRVRAAGQTPDQLRQTITRLLDAQTPDPQVVVQRLAGDGSSVTVVGGVGGQGVYPIEGATRTLATMLARAGGVVIEPDVALVKVMRGNRSGQVWLRDLYSDPRLDIALRPGDRIMVERDARVFVALGATGSQTRVPFERQRISAIEAIALVGGLNSSLADPTGVFVFRDEPAEIANGVLGRSDLEGTQRFVYVLDLTEPTGMFLARDFVIRDGDTVYVTEAPFVQWNKTISSITGSLGTVSSVQGLAN